MNIKLLKNHKLTAKDCEQIGRQIGIIMLALDSIMEITPYKFNTGTLDELLKVRDKVDLIAFEMNEEAFNNGILDKYKWSEQSEIIRKQRMVLYIEEK